MRVRQRLFHALAMDAPLCAAAVALVLISSAAMASATSTINPRLALRHEVWVVVGMLASLGVWRTNYRHWIDGAWLWYALSLLLLCVVPIAGAVRLGATRWLSLFGLSVQPSELAKLATICALARYLADQPVPLPWRSLVLSSVLAVLPAGLIFLQPDLGSASIFCAVWCGMVWVAGAARKLPAILMCAAAVTFPMAWHLLKDYQRDRLLVFLDPSTDPLGAGYTIIQSVIAIGSGQGWGRGWFAGTQNQLSFLPERHSDFIFSVIGEEWGFLGCACLLIAFWVLLSRISRIALTTSQRQGALLATGVFTWLAYQAMVNIGMVMGLLPVVGIPLPLVSYGGSSMVIVWIALGLVQGIRRHDV